MAVTTDNASNNLTFLQEVSTELDDSIKFDNYNQHVRCLAHIINLAAQEVLKSLKAISSISDNEFLDEETNNNEQGVAGLLHKVNNFLKLLNNI